MKLRVRRPMMLLGIRREIGEVVDGVHPHLGNYLIQIRKADLVDGPEEKDTGKTSQRQTAATSKVKTPEG